MTSWYLIVKWIHVLSSVLLVGTGFGSAYYLYFANRSASVVVQAHVGRLVVRADWYFTAAPAVLQPVTGLWLVYQGGWPLSAPWIRGSLLLYGLAGACWLAAVWLQLRMAAMARVAWRSASALPSAYLRASRRWEGLGYAAFGSMIAVYYLMVVKPGT